MGNKKFSKLCRAAVVRYVNERLDKTDGIQITEDNVFIVWICKTLQNHKALVSTTLPDGMYYELTYNGDKDELYFDAYKKVQNLCIKPSEFDLGGSDEKFIKFDDIVKMMGSCDGRDRLIAEYIRLKQWYESIKVFNNKVEAGRYFERPVITPDTKIPYELSRELQSNIGHLLHAIEVAAVIEDIDLEDAINYYIKKALDAERECHGFTACECKTAEEIERENTCCQKDCAPPCEEGIYGPSEEDLPEGILSLEETVEVCERCLFPGEGTDTCSDCIIKDRCGDMVRDRSLIYHLKKYAEHK